MGDAVVESDNKVVQTGQNVLYVPDVTGTFSPQSRSEWHVRNLERKSDTFSAVGLSLVTNPACDFHRQDLKVQLGSVLFGELGIASLLFADDVVLFMSSVHDLQLALVMFVAV